VKTYEELVGEQKNPTTRDGFSPCCAVPSPTNEYIRIRRVALFCEQNFKSSIIQKRLNPTPLGCIKCQPRPYRMMGRRTSSRLVRSPTGVIWSPVKAVHACSVRCSLRVRARSPSHLSTLSNLSCPFQLYVGRRGLIPIHRTAL
jgi:hypothetical protein